MVKKIIEVVVNGSVYKIHCDDLAKMHYFRKKKTPPLPNLKSKGKKQCRKMLGTDTPEYTQKISKRGINGRDRL